MSKAYHTIKQITMTCDRCKKKETFEVYKEENHSQSKHFRLECSIKFGFNGYDHMQEQHGVNFQEYDLCDDCGREFNEKWIKMK